MDRSLEQLQTELISSGKKGYPFLLSASFVFLLFTYLPLIFPMDTVYLIWIFGLMVIFPIGTLLSKALRVNVTTPNNPLVTLGRILAAPQAFYIPVFIIVYMYIPEYLPFTIGLLAGSLFLPYLWVYKSKTYLFVTLGTCITSLILGGILVNLAFTILPLCISIVYGIGVILIHKELKPA